jgi:AraC family transcriptional regulator
MTVTPPVSTAARGDLGPLRAAVSRKTDGAEGRLLYGDLQDIGVSMRLHEPSGAGEYEWSQSVARETVVLCLNLLGEGKVHCPGTVLEFGAGTAIMFFTGAGPCKATRLTSQKHRFITLEFSAAYLRRHLLPSDGALHPAIEAFIGGKLSPNPAAEIRKLRGQQETDATRLMQPLVFQRARELWYQGQVLQLIAEYFFERHGDDELFCDRQKRLAHERAQKVIAILQRDLVTPPALEAIGREIGCSPFHLSRTFSQETGMTIPQYLRKLRINRAAELLAAGKHNVTEAAMEVGYSSLSHFSQAFCQLMGCCPGLYPLKGAIQR